MLKHLAFIIMLGWALYLSAAPFVIFSDPHANANVFDPLASRMVQDAPQAAFVAGDLVNWDKNTDEWQTFIRMMAPLKAQCPVYCVPGNHNPDRMAWGYYMDKPSANRHWAVEQDSILFIGLNSNEPLDMTAKQYKWLAKVLAGHKPLFTIIIMHHPLYTNGIHWPDEKGVRKDLEPLFLRYGVDMVFSGHNHMYERLERKGIVYITTGGAGGKLYPRIRWWHSADVSRLRHHYCRLERHGRALSMQAVNAAGRVLDEITLTARAK